MSSIAFSPDGATVATGDGSKKLTLFAAQLDKSHLAFLSHPDRLSTAMLGSSIAPHLLALLSVSASGRTLTCLAASQGDVNWLRCSPFDRAAPLPPPCLPTRRQIGFGHHLLPSHKPHMARATLQISSDARLPCSPCAAHSSTPATCPSRWLQSPFCAGTARATRHSTSCSSSTSPRVSTCCCGSSLRCLPATQP